MRDEELLVRDDVAAPDLLLFLGLFKFIFGSIRIQ
jgi:hypothetical protein